MEQLAILVDASIGDTQKSLQAFMPELVICVTILGMLLVRLFRVLDVIPGFLLAGIGVAVALFYAEPWVYLSAETLPARRELFSGMLVLDSFTVFIRTVLLVFALLFIVFTRLSKFPESSDSVDFYTLILGSTLGMCLMASSNHLLMVFMAIEMASVPSYALAGSLRYSRKSSEAALKYSIFGAGTAGVMLYGISLIAGVTNSVHLPTIANQLSTMELGHSELVVLGLGGLMLMVGLAFKLSAVPFHFWCPDVFEGASAEIGAFLSVASKAAALALLVRVALGIGAVAPDHSVAEVSQQQISSGLFSVADTLESPSPSDHSTVSQMDQVRSFAGLLITFLAIVTCTFGNLAAYGQTNIKRLLAYSTIAHAGYMMMAVPAALAVAGDGGNPEAGQFAIAALGLYIATYVIMNLAAFAVVAFFRNSFGSEEISDYAGLVKRSPIVVILFSLTLFSLVGLPPLAGFLGKFAIFASLAQSFRATGQSHLMVLLIAGGINTAISLFYYLRVVKVMTFDPEPDSSPAKPMNLVSNLGAIYLFVLAVPIVTLMVYLNPLNEWTQAAAKQLF
ncbi:MAG: NADH-quinone oxidoreductase subunit N [Planctomycetales bacterium]|nr:NADH-quinone oxidoreductase subunit N [Planctomycetales bacterium]